MTRTKSTTVRYFAAFKDALNGGEVTSPYGDKDLDALKKKVAGVLKMAEKYDWNIHRYTSEVIYTKETSTIELVEIVKRDRLPRRGDDPKGG